MSVSKSAGRAVRFYGEGERDISVLILSRFWAGFDYP
jgi:hypothetical protein